MSIPNSLTTTRILLTPVFVVLFLSESAVLKQLSLAVFVVAALTDWYDGVIARKYGYVSRWGKFLDPLADKILTAAALFSFVYLRLVDAWMVWIIVGRDALITALRSIAEWQDKPIVTSKSAQAKTFSEYIVIYYILILSVARHVPVIASDYGALIETLMHPQVLFGMMMLVLISSVITGAQYLIDNRTFIHELYVRYLRTAPTE
jgi:CDP-diacylglycerol--glycerol-3-phosphate 3-phosphatidyltransferase